MTDRAPAIDPPLARERLLAIAADVRRFLEPAWADWHAAWGGDPPTPLSRHTCGRTSLFLAKVLQAHGLPAAWKSGVPRATEDGPELCACGFFIDGRWESHAWVETCGWIVDLTADQFGADPVIVTRAPDPRYAAGDGDRALPEFIVARQKTVDELWPKWVSSGEGLAGESCLPA